MDLEAAIQVLESHLDLLIATEARERVFVHAGAVGWHGQIIIIPGRSLSGKTTLVAALLREGATYYSDEYAVLDAAGHVHPFQRPLSIRQADRGSRRVDAQEFGTPTGVQPLPVGLIVVTTHKPGAQWRPRRLSPGQALLALLDNTVTARTRPAEALPVLRHVVSNAPALKGQRSEAKEVAQRLLHRVTGPDGM